MPLYEYRCLKCGSIFEVIQKVGEPPLKKCLKCGADVKKTISPPALQFKGSGWYVTDYVQKAANPSQKTEPSEKSESPSENKKEKKKGPASSSSSSEPS